MTTKAMHILIEFLKEIGAYLKIADDDMFLWSH